MQLSSDRKIASEISNRKDPIRCLRFVFAREQIVAFRMAMPNDRLTPWSTRCKKIQLLQQRNGFDRICDVIEQRKTVQRCVSNSGARVRWPLHHAVTIVAVVSVIAPKQHRREKVEMQLLRESCLVP